jgi:DNA-binding response OmpR family regulator
LQTEYSIVEAPDGPTALKLIGSHHIDLILLDVLLPGMTGLEVLSRLRPVRSRPPVVLISGAATVPTAVTGMQLGALDCLVKPFANEELLTRVRGVLAGRPTRNPVQQANRPVLLVGGDPGVIATLHVAINTRLPVSSAWTLSQASEKIRSQPYGAVVLDDSLPPASSLAFLQASRPLASTSSLIVLASRPEQWPITEAAGPATTLVVPKPYRVNDLLDHLGAVCVLDAARPIRFNSVLGRALDHFRDHFTGTLTLTAVAPAIGVSPGHLAALCRADLDMTPRQFVARVRVEMAKHLLRDTDMKIEAIADVVGFHDASHLSRVFSRYVKLRPGHYRH